MAGNTSKSLNYFFATKNGDINYVVDIMNLFNWLNYYF